MSNTTRAQKRRRRNRTDGGDCFPAAVKTQRRLGSEAIVAHGIATGRGPLAGVRFVHAWVELGPFVVDESNGQSFVMTIDEYYHLGCIQGDRVRRYTRAEVDQALVDHAQYGPWDDALFRFTPTKKK